MTIRNREKLNQLHNYIKENNGHIDLEELKDLMIESVEEELNQYNLSDNIIIDTTTIFDTGAAKELYRIFIMCGCTFPTDDDKPIIPFCGVMYIMIPKETDFSIRYNDDDSYTVLDSKTIPMMIKSLIIALIDRCCLRFPHQPIDQDIIKIRFKVTDKFWSKDNINKFDSTIQDAIENELKDRLDEAPDHLRQMVNNVIDKSKTFSWYGAHFEISPDGSKMVVHVPKYSEFSMDGVNPYCGELLFNDFKEMCKICGINQDIEMVIDDIEWTKDDFNVVYAAVNSLSSDFKKNIGLESIDEK